jgi:hypothetical protein
VSVFTIFNCGTAFHRDSNDVVAYLNIVTTSPHHINDGPGAKIGGAAHNPWDATRLTGAAFGVGVDANVDAAVSAIDEHRRLDPTPSVALLGWSRGGVTCFKIANKLQASVEHRSIPIDIFAIDPVPGSAGAANWHMWREIEISANVRHCVTIYAQHERRREFAAVVPDTVPDTCTFDPIVIPGTHSSIVVATTGLEDAYYIVLDLAKAFLRKKGVALSDRSRFTNQELVHRYTVISENFRNYQNAGQKEVTWLTRKIASADRTLLSQNYQGSKLTALQAECRPFFINNHHRECFERCYPYVARELNEEVQSAFARERMNQWVPELLDVMMEKDPQTAQWVMGYMFAIGRYPN